MIVLGVDPGSRACGYGVIAVDSRHCYRYIECGVLRAEPGKPMERRLGDIAGWLTEIIGELQPVEIALEDVFSHVNPRSALALAQARGAVLAVAGLSGLPVFSYAPALVKKTVTGRGAASKQQVANMVRSLVGLQTTPASDAADALAVAITHAHRMEAAA